jgi:hypothetical protein
MCEELGSTTCGIKQLGNAIVSAVNTGCPLQADNAAASPTGRSCLLRGHTHYFGTRSGCLLLAFLFSALMATPVHLQ